MSEVPHWVFAYNTTLDISGIIASHAKENVQASGDRLTNFLGVRIDPIFVPSVLAGREGQVEPTPFAGNWHADPCEWAAVFRAVDLAKGSFRVVELGCGWGCWLVNSGAAARARGLTLNLIGIEGDAGHVAFAKRACAENGFSDAETTIHHGIAGPRHGTALFPRQVTAGASWGLEPVFDASPEQIEEAARSGAFDTLPVLPLADVVANTAIDLLHIDIQGGEVDFLDACAADVDRFVRYLVVGTHSRSIEGRIFEMLLGRGWLLEIERPAVLRLDLGDKPVTVVDGVQAWRNPNLPR